ncbi:DUF6412 domain-containing protein [Allosalinactinospora lopnorensis]|uniref:DUF6412 domain-containing protein n=1 Tax=Allosalinactinospora lopnorensis TaxID=1352348 RepID=UPI000696AB05|nr:DUF6412 domain-containing protein [Allosalinactinospora lopnorensis]
MAAIYTLLHLLFFGAESAWPLSSLPTAGALTALAVVAIGAALAWMAVRGIRAWPLLDGGVSRCGAVLRRAERAVVAPVRHPGTPGKPRPRAPGAAPVAA